MAGDGTPIIIKKKKSHGHGHHGGSWKVAYADFVTAMMAFFMVMWILGLSDEAKIQISGYFNDPLGYSKTTPLQRNIVPSFGEPTSAGAGTISNQKRNILAKKTLAVQKVQTALEAKIAAALAKGWKPTGGNPEMNDPTADKSSNAVAPITAEELKAAVEQATPGSIADLLAHIDVQVVEEGLRIEFLEDSDRDIFFDTGSKDLKPEALKVIAMIAPPLIQAGRPLQIEGHTDARAYSKQSTYTNWELSFDRANSLRKALLANGVPPSLFDSIHGLADRYPKNPSDRFAGENRRVAILIPFATEKEKNEIDITSLNKNLNDSVNIKPTIKIDEDKPVSDPLKKKKSNSFWDQGKK